MPKPTIPDLTGTGLTQSRYIDLWFELTKEALHGCLSFHGADSGAHAGGAETIMLMADNLMAGLIERLLQAKEDRAAEAEKEKG